MVLPDVPLVVPVRNAHCLPGSENAACGERRFADGPRQTASTMVRTLTPEQIETYAATLRERSAEAARLRRERQARAWVLAREAAELLRARFGASGVRVFGSLGDGEHFTERSDIDMAAGRS